MNRLAGEKSPYLLQHKDNPVDWYPWGPEAFARAKAEDKPILLSIGYSTCHWCHVMEHESFSVAETAAVMNEHFVCVKLDREERPDVDKLYMTAVQAMTGQGGWPLNAFLTPDLKPFYGGTYFPPDSRYGRPSWTGLLRNLAHLWETRREDVVKDAENLTAAVAKYAGAGDAARGRPEAGAFEIAEKNLRASFDAENGGFGEAPKFPMPANIRFLLRRHARTAGADAKTMAVETLRAMTRGGIFDQLGGGYARYSTDYAWRIPHFEKMLYDNAQILECLADAWALTRDPEINLALERTVEYLERDLRSPKGGFFSAEDADSLPKDSQDGHKEEGAFYLWTRAEVDSLLGKESAAFCARYGIVEGTNALADPHGEFVGKCVLYDNEPAAMDEVAAAKGRAVLFAARAKRPRPSLDDKVLTSWNGLVIAGLARAYGATGNGKYRELAVGAAEFIRSELSSPDGKTLWRRWRDGEKAINGMADDYAYLAYGLLALYEVTFSPVYLEWTINLVLETIRRFAADGGGLYQTALGDGSELFARAIEDHDGVEPAPSSVLADVCLRLYQTTGNSVFEQFAERTFERFGPTLSTRPLGLPFLLTAFDRALGQSKTVIIAGVDLAGGSDLLAALRAAAITDLVSAGYRQRDKGLTAKIIPIVAEMSDVPRARAYVCVGQACGLPIESADLLSERLK